VSFAEQLTEALGGLTDRKTVLRRAGAAGMGVLLGAMGLGARTAEAVQFQHGCSLCDATANPAGCTQLACTWCWYGTCHQNPSGSSNHRTQCCEGYRAGSSCGGGCADRWACSFFGSHIAC
jgi:hypothetical protein